MRALLLAACALLIAFAATTADASLTAHASHAPSKRLQAHRRLHRRATGSMTQPNPSNSGSASSNWGNVYKLVDELSVAVATKNFTWASSLIADDAVIYIDTVSCGAFDKPAFLKLLQEQPSIMTFVQLQGWAGYFNGSSAMFQATVGAVYGANANAGMANQTFWDRDIGIFAAVNEAGTQLEIFEEWIDRSYAQQNNATQMLRVYKDITDGANLMDISVFERLLRDDVSFFRATAWDQVPPMQLDNKTAVLAEISGAWSRMSKATIQTTHAYPACEFVVSFFLWSGIYNEGGAAMNKFAFALMLDEDMKVAQIAEYALRPWL